MKSKVSERVGEGALETHHIAVRCHTLERNLVDWTLWVSSISRQFQIRGIHRKLCLLTSSR